MIKRTYYCDCTLTKTGKIKRGVQHETQVYEDFTCVRCGYYAKIKTERVLVEPDGIKFEELEFKE